MELSSLKWLSYAVDETITWYDREVDPLFEHNIPMKDIWGPPRRKKLKSVRVSTEWPFSDNQGDFDKFIFQYSDTERDLSHNVRRRVTPTNCSSAVAYSLLFQLTSLCVFCVFVLLVWDNCYCWLRTIDGMVGGGSVEKLVFAYY